MNQAALELLIQLKDEASAGIQSIGNTLSSLGGMALAGVAVAGAAIGGFVIDGIAAAAEAEEAVAQLEAVIKSTGGAAGMTSQELQDLAAGFQKTTKFGEETVIAAESILLTFTGIGKDVFPDVTAMTLDMAQALGTDAKGAAMQLGKALNDPVAGLSALSRSGVSFSESQKETIKSMVAMGDVAGAQKLMLAELQKEFGGSAEAAGKTFSGQLAIAKNMLGEFGEMVGGKILPVITPMISSFIRLATDALPRVEAAIEPVLYIFGQVGKALGALSGSDGNALSDYFDNIATAISKLFGFKITDSAWQWIYDFADGIENVFDDIMGAIDMVNKWGFMALFAVMSDGSAFGKLLANFGLTSAQAEGLSATLEAAFWAIRDAIDGVVAFVVAQWPMVQATIAGVINAIVTTVLPILLQAFDSISNMVSGLVAWFILNWPKIRYAVSEAIDAIVTNVLPVLITAMGGLMEVIGKVVSWVQENWPLIMDTVLRVIQAIRNIIEVTLPILRAIFETTFPIIKGIVETAMDLILGVIRVVMQLITGDTRGALLTIQETFSTIWTRIRTALGEAINKIGDVIENGMRAAKASIGRILGEAVDFVLTLPTRFAAAGRSLIEGLWDGIAGAGTWFRDKFATWLSANLPDWAKKVLGIASPSKVAAESIGAPFVAGIMAGIEGQRPQLMAMLSQLSNQMTLSPDGRFGVGGSLSPSFAGGSSGSVIVNIYPGSINSAIDVEDLAFTVAKRIQARKSR